MTSASPAKEYALDVSRLERLLPERLVASVRVVDSVGSTNVALKDEVIAGNHELPDFSVLMAEEQTEGQGRLSRQWRSEKYMSLSTSFLLRLNTFDDAAWLVLLLAEAAVHSAQGVGVPAQIKWPNDIVVLDSGSESQITRKLGGILGQFVTHDDEIVMIVGVGLNIFDKPDVVSESLAPTQPGCFADFVDEFQTRELDDISMVFDRTNIAASLINRFYENYAGWKKAARTGTAGRWASHRITDLMATIGQLVKVMPTDGPAYVGQATGLNDSAELIVVHDGGQEELNAADITHLRPVSDFSQKIHSDGVTKTARTPYSTEKP